MEVYKNPVDMLPHASHQIVESLHVLRYLSTRNHLQDPLLMYLIPSDSVQSIIIFS